jgi:hypothetical protein
LISRLDRALGSSRGELGLGLELEMTSKYEPVFDAADFVRCGRDLFVQ